VGGPALLHTISFSGVVVVLLLMAWIALALESRDAPPSDHPSSGHPPGDRQLSDRPSRTTQEAAKPGDEPGQAIAPEREAV
jgi:hypothetical protein